ncbi:MAG: hypothetical protein JXB60_02310 [Candidatus Cloacimonetes bacterium]|nr:hypothetical protein [Candidatus Cloacimonadota bacterium]
MKFLQVIILIPILVSCLQLAAFDTGKKPFQAAALSFFIPGAGQIYNESYLKFGIVCALESTMIGLTVYHHVRAEDYYDRYLQSGSDRDYDRYLDYYYKRQNDLWWTGVVIFFSTIDAFVDAHLYNFEKKRQELKLKFQDNALLLSWEF